MLYFILGLIQHHNPEQVIGCQRHSKQRSQSRQPVLQVLRYIAPALQKPDSPAQYKPIPPCIIFWIPWYVSSGIPQYFKCSQYLSRGFNIYHQNSSRCGFYYSASLKNLKCCALFKFFFLSLLFHLPSSPHFIIPRGKISGGGGILFWRSLSVRGLSVRLSVRHAFLSGRISW